LDALAPRVLIVLRVCGRGGWERLLRSWWSIMVPWASSWS
jgi:hypothetical protein